MLRASPVGKSAAFALSGLLLLALLLPSLSCAKKEQGSSTAYKRYTLRGEVLRLDAKSQTAIIKHEAIQGWMDAMTMEFPVKPESEWKKLSAGDHIEATVFVSDLEYYVGEVRVTGKAPASGQTGQ